VSRLYLRFYFALLGSLAVFAIATAAIWHRVDLFVAQGSRLFGHPIVALHVFLLALTVLALAVAVGALPIIRRLTQRLERLQAGVESLGAGDLSARVAVEGNDEVARLATSFNRAASRIEALVGAHKALLANASHELRTPLARIRMAVELMKQSADPKRKAGLDQDIAELDALIDELLLSSRLDAVHELDTREDVDLLALAAEECARYENVDLVGADPIGADLIDTHLSGEQATVRGDPRLLRRMLRNLLENADRHGLPPVHVTLARDAQCVTLVVVDEGPAIPPEQRERLFEPFYRRADSRENRGIGLGLALVRQIARRHGGDAQFTPTESGRNSFAVMLPAVR
jgi:signal transduction histidine kinase